MITNGKFSVSLEVMPGVCLSDEEDIEDSRIDLARKICYETVSPHSLCEEHGVGFKEFLDTLNPNRTRVDFESLQCFCLQIYGKERERVKEIFSEFEGRISLSFDIRKYEFRNATAKYICLAAHFIDNDWKLQNWVIKYSRWNLSCPTAITFKSLKDWGIEGKVFAFTVGRTSGAAELLKKGILNRWEGPMDNHMFHWQISCCDVITQIVQEGYNEIAHIISKVQLLIGFESSHIWYATSSKLKDALKMEALGEFSSERTRREYDVPTTEEWGKVRSICRITDRIYKIVKKLFEVERPTSNIFLPYLQEIRAFLIEESTKTDEFVKAVAKSMMQIFDEYWKDIFLVLAIGAFLDPRYKMKFIELSSPKPEDGDGEGYAETSCVLEIIRKLHGGYAVQNHQKDYLLASSSSESEDEENEDEKSQVHKRTKRVCCYLADSLNIRSKCHSSLQTTEDDQSHESDLDLYLEEPIFPRTEHFSVLLWWKDNCSKYPHLSEMARDFLAIPLSVASSCEAYYSEPRQAERTVVSVKSELMNALMCTRSWKLDCEN